MSGPKKLAEKPLVTENNVNNVIVGRDVHARNFVVGNNTRIDESEQAQLSAVLQALKEAVVASPNIPDDKKQEHMEIVEKIGEEATKSKPNQPLLDGLMNILKAIPDLAKAVATLAPFLSVLVG